MMLNTKAKGTKGERELVAYFNDNDWSCIRVAGSGSSRYPSPDLLAGNAIRRLAIECKVVGDYKKYFQNEEVEQLRVFSKRFGAESWIAIRFPRRPWYFVMLEDLEKTNSSWAISLELAERKGLRVEEVIQKGELLPVRE